MAIGRNGRPSPRHVLVQTLPPGSQWMALEVSGVEATVVGSRDGREHRSGCMVRLDDPNEERSHGSFGSILWSVSAVSAISAFFTVSHWRQRSCSCIMLNISPHETGVKHVVSFNLRKIHAEPRSKARGGLSATILLRSSQARTSKAFRIANSSWGGEARKGAKDG